MIEKLADKSYSPGKHWNIFWNNVAFGIFLTGMVSQIQNQQVPFILFWWHLGYKSVSKFALKLVENSPLKLHLSMGQYAVIFLLLKYQFSLHRREISFIALKCALNGVVFPASIGGTLWSWLYFTFLNFSLMKAKYLVFFLEPLQNSSWMWPAIPSFLFPQWRVTQRLRLPEWC